jgi:hypothetical protein
LEAVAGSVTAVVPVPALSIWSVRPPLAAESATGPLLRPVAVIDSPSTTVENAAADAEEIANVSTTMNVPNPTRKRLRM